LKNLERAIRVYRALTESPVKVDSASLRSWVHVERALAHAPALLTEMKALPRPIRERVIAYVGEFTPLVESRPIFQMPDGLAVKHFIKEVTPFGGYADHLDNGGLVAATGPDMKAIESVAARHGGVPYKGPKLADAFDYVDHTLPEAMMSNPGLEPALVEKALIASLYGSGKGGNLSESASHLFAGFKVESTMDRFKARLANFARPKPVLGVSRRLAEAVRLSGLATPKMIALLEAGEPPGVSPGNSGVSNAPQSDRGGVGKDQPNPDGAVANSKSGQQKQQTPPTEHVPSTEQGSATNAVRLPDGTEVPMDTLRAAFAKMLHNMATQVEQGTVGGQPSPRGADQQDATGTEPPAPSVPQQQVAAQSASQQAAGAGGEPANGQPAQANGQPPAPPEGQQAAAPPANGQPGQAAPGAPAAPAPGQPPAQGQQPPAAPGQPPAAGGDIEGTLAKAEQGDEEALKQAQGMQGQMDDAQKQRLQAIIAKKGGGNGNGASPPKQESRHATLRRAYAAMESVRERDILTGIEMVRQVGLRDQPSKLAEAVRDRLAALALHESSPIRAGARRLIETSRASEAKSSKGGREFVGKEVSKLMTKGPSSGPQKGKPFGQKQAVAAALNVAREKGYKVGANPNESISEAVDQHAATELELYIENERALYNQRQSIEANLRKKMAKGQYDSRLAPKLWMYWVDEGARRYMKEFSGPGSKMQDVFNKETREAVAKSFAKDFEDRVKLGEAHSRDAYARTGQGDGFVVWEQASVIPGGSLPEGLSYGAGEAKPGTQVAIMESGTETCVVRLPNGDVVRAPKVHVREDAATGYLADQRVVTCSLSGMMEALAKDGVKQAVIVAGSPTSGRGYFIRTKLAPWARRMQERVGVAPFPSLESATGAEARREAVDEMRLATAREDHAALAAVRNESMFDQVLVTDPRFRHVAESGGVMLRDALPWKLYQTCRESFDRYFSIPAVRKYYNSMGGGKDKLAEAAVKRMVSERRTPAFVQMGGVLVVDAPPRTNIVKIAEAARASGLQVTLVEMRLDLATVLNRGKAAKLREARLIKSYNAARAGVDEARKSPHISRFVTYAWRSAGGPFEGRFVCEGGDGSMPGKNDVVSVEKDNIDGDLGPTREKSMAVTVESRKRHVREQLDVGQAAEAESCAGGMKEAGEQLKAAREAVFKLTAETLVKCAAMAQATGAKRTQKELAKAQQLAATFLDDIQNLAAQVDKANEVMKGENGGMGGDNLDAMKQMQANGAATPPAPTPAPAPAASPAVPATPALESVETADQAVALLLDTPLAERIARGEDYRSLNEAISGYMPNLDVRARVEAIDRIKAVTSVPADASLRVEFNPVDHRLLAEAVPFGSLAGVLVQRTRGGARTLASESEMHHAITALRKHGKAAHLMLANTLEAAIGGRGSLRRDGLTEFQDRSDAPAGAGFIFRDKRGSAGADMDRKGAFAELKRRDASDNWKLNVARISVDQAMTWAEATYRRYGGDLATDLPNLDKNFAWLKSRMKYAQDIPREYMPVIEPEDVQQFAKDLEGGHVDVFAPWAPEHAPNLFPWEKAGNPPMFGNKEWITLGVKDGSPEDDVVRVHGPAPVTVRTLKPIQNQIWFDKLILSTAAFGPATQNSFAAKKGFLIGSSDGYIIDGHHRFGQIALYDPDIKALVLSVGVDVETLLKVARSYGSALGHKAKG
jgi:hypothetical protein